MDALCIGGPRDGERLPLSKELIISGELFVLDGNGDEFHYSIYTILDDTRAKWYVAAPRDTNVIAALIAGYKTITERVS